MQETPGTVLLITSLISTVDCNVTMLFASRVSFQMDEWDMEW